MVFKSRRPQAPRCSFVVEPSDLEHEVIVLDQPDLSERQHGWMLKLHGWVGLPAPLQEPGQITIRLGEQAALTVPLTAARPPAPIKAKLPSAERYFQFKAWLNLLGAPDQVPVKIEARLNGQQQGLTLALSKQVDRAGSGRERQPLRLVSIGRTGTTRLMQLFARHPDIAAFPSYPFEHRYGMYWAQLLRTLTQPWPEAWLTDSAEMLNHSFHLQLHHPFNLNPLLSRREIKEPLQDWIIGDYLDQLIIFCKTSLQGYYDQIEGVSAKKRTRYFVEKMGAGSIYNILSDLYAEPKTVLLLRDPRDMLCSMKAFNQLRGRQEFGEDLFSSDEAWLDKLIESTLELHGFWQARQHSVHLLRYESLVTDPRAAISSVLGSLNLKRSPGILKHLLEPGDPGQIPAHHLTASSPAESIGRWRRDLNPETIQHVQTRWSQQLLDMGYPDA
jgi:hypothetical protein